MTEQIAIQPADLPGGVQPYPYWINPDGTVGRQDFWKGAPQALIGFVVDASNPTTVDLLAADFLDTPHAAVGMFPVFAYANGSWNTHLHQRIDSVRASRPASEETPR